MLEKTLTVNYKENTMNHEQAVAATQELVDSMNDAIEILFLATLELKEKR